MKEVQEEKTQALEENIVKYFEALKNLHTILSATSRLSMMKFSEDNNLSKNLSTVLSKGGVIVCTRKGRVSEWKWNTIPPTRHMAIKVLKEFASLNPERKPYKKRVSVVNSRILESYTVKLLFGLIKINIKLNYKNS